MKTNYKKKEAKVKIMKTEAKDLNISPKQKRDKKIE